MKKKLLFGGAMLGLAAATAAVAYAAPGEGHSRHQQGGHMQRADSDGDGAISKAEVTAMTTSRFDKMDANKDGKIDAADRTERHKAHFNRLDADKNGSISETEFMAAHSDRMEKRAERRERREGRMGQRGERGIHGRHGGGMRLLKMADANNDKVITKAEISAAIDARFAKTDSDKDGKISREERAAARKEMRDHMRGTPSS